MPAATTEVRCALCRTPVGDAAVCWTCIDGDAEGLDTHGHPSLARNLGDIPALSPALVVSYIRGGRTGSHVGSRSAQTVIPFDHRASAAAHGLRNELTTDIRLLDMGDAPASGSSPQLAIWMLGRLERIRHHADAVGIVTGMARAVDHARRAVDLPADRWYAGPCWTVDDGGECTAELYAMPGAESVQCAVCGTWHDVAERRRWLLAAAKDHLANAALLAAALPILGEQVNAERIRQWALRGRLVPHGHDEARHPLYRVGDVIELLTESAQVSARKERRG